ncbi:MAG: GNAT family N-acetyltransferase [Nostocaceae cyanobacterium]|nr:GNAT family N-acetyltransferase [Nostocaceae cyanobacterium]
MIADKEIIIIETIDELDRIKPLWNKLKNRHQPENIFVDIDFYRGMFKFEQNNEDSKYIHSSPYVVIFYQANEPVAGIIGRRYRCRLKFQVGYVPITMPPVRCLDVEIGGLMANDSNAVNLVRDHLASLVRNRSIDLLNLEYLPQHNDFWQLLLEDAQLGVQSVRTNRVEWIASIADQNSGERLVKNHKSRTAQRIRTAERKLYKEFDNRVEVSCFSHAHEVKDFLLQADAIAKESYQHAINVGVENNAAWRSELELLAQAGCFRGYILYGEDKPICYVVGPAYNGLFLLYATAFNPQFGNLSPGGFLLRKVMDMLFAEGIHTFHFGYGDADYKRRFGTDCFEGAALHFYTKLTAAR